jgi:hypothetical protein
MADDIQLAASIDDTGVTASTTKMTAEVKAFSTVAQREFKKVEQSQKQMESGSGKLSYRLGQVSMQAQDVAVQLQGGARATTVIAQQGSQLLSIFGPGGAMLGGVLAIGAGIYGWVTGENAATEAALKLKDAMKQAAKEQHNLAFGSGRRAGDDRNAADVATEKAMGNDVQAEHKRLEYEYTKKIEDINRRGASEKLPQKLIDDELAAAKNLYETESALARSTGDEKNRLRRIEKAGKEQETKEHIEQINKETEELKKSLQIQTASQRMVAIGQENDRLRRSEAFQKGEELAKTEQQIVKNQIEGQKVAKDMVKDMQDQVEKSEKAKSIADKFVEQAKHLSDLASKGLKGLFDQYGLEAQSKELAKQLLTAQAIHAQKASDRVDAILDPKAAAEKRKQDRREKNAIREEAERYVDEIDQKNGGLPGHHRLSPMERQAAIKARIKETTDFRHGKQKVSIEEGDINKLAAVIAAETAKQIAK